MTSEKKGFIYTIIATTSWGISGVLGDYLLNSQSITPSILTSFRMIPAGILLLLLSYGKDGHLHIDLLKKKNFITLYSFAVLGLVAIQFAFLMAIKYTNGGTATVLQYLGPIFVLLFLCIREKRLPRFFEGFALALAFIGTYYLATQGNIKHLVLDPKGLFFGLIAALCTVVYVLAPQRLLAEHGTIPVIGWGMLLGGITFTLLANPFSQSFHLTLSGWFFVFLLVILGTVLPYGLYLEGVRLIGAVKTSMLAAIEPVSAVLFSAIFLGTSFHKMELLGILLIILAVYVIEK
ncbi:MAG: DMT family transporter [Tissierellia bacterium]|nr:DMT family transporter [Tissierellia bacterium]